MKSGGLLKRLEDLFVDDPNEPIYDPVHLAGVLVVTLVVVGCLYWLLWTLLVFEGGLAGKISAGLSVLFTSKTLKDYGYEGSPYAMGAFEGWVGNVGAFILSIFIVIVLFRMYQEGERRSHQKRHGA